MAVFPTGYHAGVGPRTLARDSGIGHPQGGIHPALFHEWMRRRYGVGGNPMYQMAVPTHADEANMLRALMTGRGSSRRTGRSMSESVHLGQQRMIEANRMLAEARGEGPEARAKAAERAHEAAMQMMEITGRRAIQGDALAAGLYEQAQDLAFRAAEGNASRAAQFQLADAELTSREQQGEAARQTQRELAELSESGTQRRFDAGQDLTREMNAWDMAGRLYTQQAGFDQQRTMQQMQNRFAEGQQERLFGHDETMADKRFGQQFDLQTLANQDAWARMEAGHAHSQAMAEGQYGFQLEQQSRLFDQQKRQLDDQQTFDLVKGALGQEYAMELQQKQGQQQQALAAQQHGFAVDRMMMSDQQRTLDMFLQPSLERVGQMLGGLNAAGRNQYYQMMKEVSGVKAAYNSKKLDPEQYHTAMSDVITRGLNFPYHQNYQPETFTYGPFEAQRVGNSWGFTGRWSKDAKDEDKQALADRWVNYKDPVTGEQKWAMLGMPEANGIRPPSVQPLRGEQNVTAQISPKDYMEMFRESRDILTQSSGREVTADEVHAFVQQTMINAQRLSRGEPLPEPSKYNTMQQRQIKATYAEIYRHIPEYAIPSFLPPEQASVEYILQQFPDIADEVQAKQMLRGENQGQPQPTAGASQGQQPAAAPSGPRQSLNRSTMDMAEQGAMPQVLQGDYPEVSSPAEAAARRLSRFKIRQPDGSFLRFGR